MVDQLDFSDILGTKETEEALDTWEQTLVRMAKQGSPSAKKALSDLRKYRSL